MFKSEDGVKQIFLGTLKHLPKNSIRQKLRCLKYGAHALTYKTQRGCKKSHTLYTYVIRKKYEFSILCGKIDTMPAVFNQTQGG